jgi:hypothetical protein
MDGDEEGAELSEPLKVGLAVFVKLIGQVIQVGDTIFDYPDPLGIKPLRAIEEIHDDPLITVSSVTAAPSY